MKSVFYLLLAALIAVDLTRSAFRAGRLFRKPDAVADVSLDSFSEPAIAAGILKHQAESCYAQARTAAGDFALSPVHDPRQARNDQPPRGGPVGPAGFGRGSPAVAPGIQSLEELRAMTQDLNVDLDGKLLVLYSENRLEDQLLDRFLQLLHEAPESQELLIWVPFLLDCSRRVGRTEEMEDAVRHLVRFHPNLKTAKELTALVQAWEAKRHAGPGLGD